MSQRSKKKLQNLRDGLVGIENQAFSEKNEGPKRKTLLPILKRIYHRTLSTFLYTNECNKEVMGALLEEEKRHEPGSIEGWIQVIQDLQLDTASALFDLKNALEEVVPEKNVKDEKLLQGRLHLEPDKRLLSFSERLFVMNRGALVINELANEVYEIVDGSSDGESKSEEAGTTYTLIVRALEVFTLSHKANHIMAQVAKKIVSYNGEEKVAILGAVNSRAAKSQVGKQGYTVSQFNTKLAELEKAAEGACRCDGGNTMCSTCHAEKELENFKRNPAAYLLPRAGLRGVCESSSKHYDTPHGYSR